MMSSLMALAYRVLSSWPHQDTTPVLNDDKAPDEWMLGS